MAEFNIDVGKLPEDVREKLAELDLELSEGESPPHVKGYITPYLFFYCHLERDFPAPFSPSSACESHTHHPLVYLCVNR